MTTTVPTPTAEQAVATVEQVVEYYGAAWAAYIFAALVFLAIVIWFTHKGKAWWRIPLWSAIAAGSLTPASTIPDQSWQSPAIIVAILGFDLTGMEGLARGLVPMITWFVGFVVAFSIVHVMQQRWPRKPKVAPVTQPSDSDVTDVNDEPSQEPKL